MLAGIRDVLIISTPTDTPRFIELLDDGSRWGLNLSYAVQHTPDGLAQAFIIGKDFIGDNPCCLILGDNIFYGQGLTNLLTSASQKDGGASVFAYHVADPERFGVVEFNDNVVISIEEKPQKPKSSFAVTGLYFYDNNVIDLAANLKPSLRGELEITDINQRYLEQRALSVEVMGRGYSWLDTGTQESFLEASHFIATIQNRQAILVGSPEEIAYSKGWIGPDELLALAQPLSKSRYGQYLQRLVIN